MPSADSNGVDSNVDNTTGVNNDVDTTAEIPPVEESSEAATTGGATPATAHTEGAEVSSEKTSDEDLKKTNRRFSRWRKNRPFFGGVFTLISGIAMLIPTYLSFKVSNIIIQVATLSGVSTALIGILLIVAGLAMWFKPDIRLFSGVAAIVLGIVALPMSNLGAFGIGTLTAVIGGSLALAFTEEEQPSKDKKSKRKKRRKNAAAVTGAIALTGLAGSLLVEPAPQAKAQLQLPSLQDLGIPGLPGLQNPPEKPEHSESSEPTEAPNIPNPPALSDELKLPKLPEIKPPELPELPKLPEIPENQRFDLTPPGPIDGLRPIQDGTYTIKTDETRLLGSLKLSLIQQETPTGPKPAIRIDADKAVLKNLRVRFPGNVLNDYYDTWQRTGPDMTTTLTGNFHIVVAGLTVTPQIAGVPLFPIHIEASMAPEELQKELAKIGLGQPDAIAEQLVMLDGTMDTYFVKSDELEAAGTIIG